MILITGDLSVTIVGPGGKIPVDVVYDEDTMKYTVHYTPDKAGPVLITVKYAGNEVGDRSAKTLDFTLADKIYYLLFT